MKRKACSKQKNLANGPLTRSQQANKDTAYTHWVENLALCEAARDHSLSSVQETRDQIYQLAIEHGFAIQPLIDAKIALTSTYTSAIRKLDDERQTLEEEQRQEICVLKTQKREKKTILADVTNKVIIAKMRCKDPIFKSLHHIFSVPILELLAEYNTSAVCRLCYAYLPRQISCLNKRAHHYLCGSFACAPMIRNNECLWDNNPQRIQQVWDDCLSMVKAKTTTRGMTIENFNLVKLPNEMISIWVSSSTNSLSIHYHLGTKKRIAFRIVNKSPDRKKKAVAIAVSSNVTEDSSTDHSTSSESDY